MHVIAILFFFSLPVLGLAAETCGLTGQLMPISTENEQNVLIAQQAAMQASMMDMKSFCEWNRMGRVAKGFAKKQVGIDYDQARAEGDKDKAARILAEDSTDAPWDASLSGHPLLKNKTRDETVFTGDFLLTIDELAGFAETGVLKGEKQTAEHFDMPEMLRTENAMDAETFKKSSNLSSTKKIAACAYVGKLTSIPSCTKNIETIIQYAKPSGGKGGGTAALPSFKRILTSKEYTAGLKTAVLKMHKKFKSKKVSGDLLSDIRNSFIESGDSNNQADDKAWEVMAVLAASGPNMFTRVADQIGANKNPNAAHLATLALMIPHLDTDAMAASPPRLYSLPKGIEFPCDSGKSYHFWMSAYLSRMLVKSGSAPDDAAAAAYMAEISYQTHSESVGRSPDSASRWQRFGDTEVGVQIDLNLAAAGAHYGADLKNQDQVKRYNISENLRSSIANMGTAPSQADTSWTSIIAGQKIRWLENYNPVSTLQSYDHD